MTMAEPSEPPVRRPRGRPVEVDASRLAEIALALFIEHGYDESSMDDVAAAAGVSRRTLFRYFTSKSDMVWGGTDEAVDRVRARLAASPADEPPIEAIRSAYMHSVTFDPALLPITRQRLRLISTHPALRAAGVERTDVAVVIIREFLAERSGVSPHDLAPLVAAYAISAAANAALYWWAEFGDGEPQVVVGEVLDRVDRGFVD
jgi:TetR/AcrR family transcriptional regulator, regulator of mycofactocin system